jgi:hypothetical protein
MSLVEEITMDHFRDVSPWEKLRLLRIDIGDFIMPMVYAGVIDRVIWIKPTWEKYAYSMEEEFQVGNLRGDGDGFSCNSGNLLFATGTETPLVNAKSVKFTIASLGDPLLDDIKFDSKTTLLDIDLDYFSTSNPARTMLKREFNISDEKITDLARSFAFENLCMDYEHIPEDIRNNYSSDDAYSHELVLKAYFLTRHVMNRFPRKGRPITDESFLEATVEARKYWCDTNATEVFLATKHFLDHAVEKVIPVTENTMASTDIRDMLRYSQLMPSHILRKPGIHEKVDELFAWLQKKLPRRPIATTVVRSEADGHTPSRLVDFLLENVYIMLYKLYAPVHQVGCV